MAPPNSWVTLRAASEGVDGDESGTQAGRGVLAPRSHCYSWMINGWTESAALREMDGGTEFVAIGVPDDFLAVRVGFANVNPTPWAVRKVIACASSCWNDYLIPIEASRTLRPVSAWSALTFQNGGADHPGLVTREGAPTEIAVAGNSADPTSGETTNAAWTFTDWVPCASVGGDPATGMRVLMLRALIPGDQRVTYTHGMMTEYSVTPSMNKGYGYFIGGLKSGFDLVTDPEGVHVPGMTPAMVAGNHLVNGQMMCLVQVLTRNAGIVGMVCGDSHQAGTATTSQINNFLLQALLEIGEEHIGTIPVGLVNTAAGGTASAQFFPRMTALLDAVRPAFVVLPGWSFNEMDADGPATGKAEAILFARMLLASEQVRRAGAVPVFLTPFPRDAHSMTPAVKQSWSAAREAILGMRSAGALVVDATPLLGAQENGAFTGAYREGLSLDSIHPNDAGQAAVARVLIPIVRDISGLRKTVAAMPAPVHTSGGGFGAFLGRWKQREAS